MTVRCAASRRSWKHRVSMQHYAKQAFRKATRLRSGHSSLNGRSNMTPNKQRVLVTSLIIFGIMIVGFFGLRTFHAFREFRGHRPPPPFKTEQPETDVELIRDWMTVPFTARMYHVPVSIIFE